MKRDVANEAETVIGEAFAYAAGTALVLDAALRIQLATPDVEALLGFAPPLQASASKVLCGDASKRPLAEALAAGQPAQVLIQGPRTGRGARMLRVRAFPIAKDGGRPHGYVLFLADASGAMGDGPVLFQGMWTRDARMKELFRILERVARTDVTVLVRGETGAGKELVAQAIHELSERKSGPFRAINCAALPPHLLESELFGHARGAFTGAVRDTPGHVQLANGGTLFLDEVAELPLELQAKLLRVIETKTVIPVGARDPIPVDVRIVSATHRSLRAEVERGTFRADLMYRLRVFPLFLPPLRDRRDDIALLAEKHVERLSEKSARKIEHISAAAVEVLRRHRWPGNVRELHNALSYAMVIGDGPVLRPSDLPPELLDPTLDPVTSAEVSGPAEPPTAGDPEARRILDVLERTGGNRDRAAKILGLSRVTLWRRMKALGLADAKA